MKAHNSIKSTFVTSMVAYAPTEDVEEGEKAKYVSALNRTVARVPAREHAFVLTNANDRTEEMRERRGSKPRDGGRLWPRRAQRERQTTATLRRRQQTRSSEHFLLHPPKWRILHVPKHQSRQGPSVARLHSDETGRPSTGPLR